MRENRIIGIDPGFDRVGVAIIEGARSKETLLHSFCIVTNRKDTHAERLGQIAREIKKTIKEFEPKVLCIEKMFFNQSTTSALKVAEARGVIIAAAAEAGLPVFEYSPQEVKIGLTGYGKADKHQMMALIPRMIKMPDTKKKRLDDEYDAIAVALTHSACAR